MPEPCEFPSLDSCQKRSLWTPKEVDLAPHPVVGLVLQVGDMEKFPQVLALQSLDPFFRVSKQGPCFIAIKEDGGDKRLEQLNLLEKLMVFLRWILFLAIAATAEAILMQISAEQS